MGIDADVSSSGVGKPGRTGVAAFEGVVCRWRSAASSR